MSQTLTTTFSCYFRGLNHRSYLACSRCHLFHCFFSFSDHLEVMFGEDVPPAPWDTEHKYQLQNLRVFFEDKEKEKLCSVDQSSTLSQVLSDPRYIKKIKAFTITFIVWMSFSGLLAPSSTTLTSTLLYSSSLQPSTYYLATLFFSLAWVCLYTSVNDKGEREAR